MPGLPSPGAPRASQDTTQTGPRGRGHRPPPGSLPGCVLLTHRSGGVRGHLCLFPAIYVTCTRTSNYSISRHVIDTGRLR